MFLRFIDVTAQKVRTEDRGWIHTGSRGGIQSDDIGSGYTGEIQIRVEDTNRYKTPEKEISKIQSKISTRILKIFWIHKKPRVFYPYPGTNQPKYRNNQYENTVHIYCSVRKSQPQKRLKKNLKFFFLCVGLFIFLQAFQDPDPSKLKIGSGLVENGHPGALYKLFQLWKGCCKKQHTKLIVHSFFLSNNYYRFSEHYLNNLLLFSYFTSLIT